MTSEEQFKIVYRAKITRHGAPELLKWLESTDFFTAPASTKYHGAYPGGLVDHSLNVWNALIQPLDASSFKNLADSMHETFREAEETLTICALLHDVCKADFYEQQADGSYLVLDRFPFGHGEKSVFLISRFMKLTDAEALAIRWHMGPYDDAARGGSREYEKALWFYPLVGALHTADMRATESEKATEMENSRGSGTREDQPHKREKEGGTVAEDDSLR